ncbi:MAG: JAB domain-containing protein [Candidatus Pacebacteria bacterium]|nr:JAB domain-containing protein [Candidatus Paceibacterota bacterium]
MTKITSPRDIYLLTKKIHKQRNESLIIFYLNSSGTVINKKTIKPKVDEIKFSQAEIFVPTLKNRARFIILAHNHPSGNLLPSKSDLTTTKILINAGEILGVRIIDHLIVTDKGFYSILQKAKTLT